MFMSAPSRRWRLVRRLFPAAGFCGAAGLLSLLGACAVGPHFKRPDAPAVTHYTNGTDPSVTVSTDGTAQTFAPGAKVAADWWRLFQSPQLDVVIQEVIARNPGLDAAQANLKQAQDNLRSGYGIFFPQAGADFDATRQKFSPLKFGENAPASLFNLFSLSGTISYVLDVFGGERRTVEALGAQADVQAATERATYITLVSNVTDAVIARAAYLAEIKATNELIDIEKQQVALSEVQFRAGTVPYSSILSIESQLDSYEATLPGLQQQVAQANDLLAALAGYAPAEWQAPTVDLVDLTLPGSLPVSLPSDLVRQRPDILAAEATAHSASAEIGVATAAMLPNITLSAGYGANATAVSRLFASRASVWNVGADIAQPIFQGGTLWFKRKAAIDSYKQSMALYRQTVLGEFQQVSDTLQALDHDAQTLAAQEAAFKTAHEALRLIQINYRSGVVNYLAVITADAQYHQAMIAELQAKTVRYQDTVALFAALGGGWWNTDAGAAEARRFNR
jgi:NodT family efflux transporter outer membrane factor (OMF) lipoprotein